MIRPVLLIVGWFGLAAWAARMIGRASDRYPVVDRARRGGL